jgi:hypothetical protein
LNPDPSPNPSPNPNTEPYPHPNRAALATFVGSCSKEGGGRLSCKLMDECLKASAKGECVFVSDQEDVGQQVCTGCLP